MRKIFSEKPYDLLILTPKEYERVKDYSKEDLVAYFKENYKGVGHESK